jgi:hypothetical protein
LPEVVAEYRKLIKAGVKSLASIEAVEESREAVRQLLVGGEIILTPTDDHTQIVGDVRFLELGEHVLRLAGLPRHIEDTSNKLLGSGGVLCHVPTLPRRVRVK